MLLRKKNVVPEYATFQKQKQAIIDIELLSKYHQSRKASELTLLRPRHIP